MKGRYFYTLAFLIVAVFGFETASAQITINLPKIPKIKKPKVEPPTTTTTTTTTTPTDSTQTNSTQTNSNTTTTQNQTSRNTTPADDSDEITKSGWFIVHLEDIQKKQKEVDTYNPAERTYFVSETQENYLQLAVSKRARDEWLKEAKVADWRKAHPDNKLDAALDALAVSLAKKLPDYKPDNAMFQFRNPAAEKLVMDSLGHTGTINAATVKVYKIGVSNANWSIQKDSDGLPSYRYKYANVYFRDTSEDDSYCHVVTVTVKQDYSGGGTYNSAIYRSSAEDEMFGCPAGK